MLLASLSLLASPAIAIQAGLGPEELADLTLEQLANIRVTLVSRLDERLSDAPASIYVIRGEDIRRSGATSLPEALRLAPTLAVARADANQYAISARGFNSVLANKMLVMIDGRTVYSPLFSGVFWEVQDVVLEDIDRIEVVSGPGGTLWGTNAVNGVIHVITKSAADTRGLLMVAGGGEERQVGAVRVGDAADAATSWRVYGKVTNQEDTKTASGASVMDASERAQAGVRLDWRPGPSTVTVLADGYVTDVQQSATERQMSGVHVLGVWTRDLGGDRSLRAQLYFDRTERIQPGAIHERLNTIDAEVQHAFPIGRHELLWGAGYRFQPDRVENLGPALAFIPGDRDLRYAAFFAQDDIRLTETFDLIVGARLEHNVYTGFEALPNVRVGWRVLPDQLVWAAWSRAVRAPSRIDRELFIPASAPHVVLAGGPGFDSEVSNVFDVGFRAQPLTSLSFALTVFYHDHERLRSTEPSPAGPVFDNRIEGSTQGAEGWFSYRMLPFWRLAGGMVEIRRTTRLEPGSTNTDGLAALGNDPNRWWKLHSSLDLGRRVTVDLLVRGSGSLPQPSVPAYTAVDARVGVRMAGALIVSLAGHNLFDASHAEWGVAPLRPEHRRSVFGRVTWEP
jgi:iron complex outermembrane receptor protein